MSANMTIDVMPRGWVQMQLGELFLRASNGMTYKNSPESGGLPISRIQTISRGVIDFGSVGFAGLKAVAEKYLLQHGDILFSHINSLPHLGKVAIYDGSMPPLVHGMNLLRLQFRTEVNPTFMFYAFQSHLVRQQVWGKAQHAVNQASVNIRQLSTVSLHIPPLNEQEKIVEILEVQLPRLDAAVASVRAVREKAERFRRSLLHAAFTGALTGQDLSEGQIPDGWRKSTISDVADVAGGRTPTKFEQRLINSSSPNRNVPFYKVGDMNSSTRFLSESRVYFSESEASDFAIEILKAGTVIFPKAGGAIATNKKRILELPGAIDLNCMGVTAKGELHEKLLYWFFESFNLSTIADGTVLPQISKKKVAALKIAFPIRRDEQLTLLDEVETEISKSEAVVNAVDAVEKKASALRLSILHAAFTGKLTKEWREGAHV